ncbi:hypothetical protein [Pseudomonas helmanticensis]|uniref:hypothetical protein n=1 Tax=Pseudomonas helmanticensis TaxID=1471381 RepID=UPI00268D0420
MSGFDRTRTVVQSTTCTGLFDQGTREKLNMNLTIRNEQSEDIQRIAALTLTAFEHEEHSSHTEHLIVDALRRAGQLTISPVTVSSDATGWYGLGPISV